MQVAALLRHRFEQLGPWPSLAVLLVPVVVVEPLKLVGVAVAGKGHWLDGTVVVVLAYAASLYVVERIFQIVKPKLLELRWFAKLWSTVEAARARARRGWLRLVGNAAAR